VCASIGCPILCPDAYAAERLEAQLEDGMRRFLSDRTRPGFGIELNPYVCPPTRSLIVLRPLRARAEKGWVLCPGACKEWRPRCVPTKLLAYASHHGEAFDDAWASGGRGSRLAFPGHA